MATEDTTEAADRDRMRLALIGCCLLAIVTAAWLMPALGSDQLAGTPIDSVLPGDRFEETDAEPATGGGSGAGGFGALNPGDTTGVGGETGLNKDTFASNDTDVHFKIESSQAAYWRTGTYDTYTGTGWERDGSSQPYNEPLSYDGLSGEEVQFRVQLAKSATALPTVWRPKSVTGLRGLEVTDTGSFRAKEPVVSGKSFRGVSVLPADNVDILRSAGSVYPTEVEQRYTQLPDDTPDRIEEFTTDLTSEDDTAYDTAMTIQNWLRTNKEYSLQASKQSDHITETFLFEMEAGYCEYFATAMTTMLRTQGIPARYTVGYSTGQPIDDNTYEVRGMNAHAWVEVYFPDVGWVKFDPTPGGSRLQTQEEILESELGENVSLQEQGSPGEVFEPGQIRDIANQTQSEQNESDGGKYDISLNRTAVPGFPVSVTVTYEDDPVKNATVFFNNESIGVTDEDGTVVGTVPDADELYISVETPPSDGPVEVDQGIEKDTNNTHSRDRIVDNTHSRDGTVDSTTTETVVTKQVGGGQLPDENRLFGPTRVSLALQTATDTRRPATLQTATDTRRPATLQTATDTRRPTTLQTATDSPLPLTVQNASNGTQEKPHETYPIESGATVTVSGDVLPARSVTVTATVEDVAVPDAAVYLNGEQVGKTNQFGRAEILLPAEPGNATIAVERSSVTGETTITIPDIELTVNEGQFPLPFTTTTVEVTAGEKAVPDAPIMVNGEQVAKTGPDGTVDIRLPLSSSATIQTSQFGLRDAATITGLARNLGIAVVAGIIAIVVPVLVLYRHRRFVRTFLGRFLGFGWIGSVVTYGQLALLTVARRGDVWLLKAIARLRRTLGYGLGVIRGTIDLTKLRAALSTWLTTKYEQVQSASQWLAARIRGESTGSGADEREESDHGHDVRYVWEQLLAQSSISSPEKRTPGEIATHAIEQDGLPPQPVWTILDAFRAVEYGSSPPADRGEHVRSALDTIQRSTRATSVGSHEPTAGYVGQTQGQAGPFPAESDRHDSATTDGGTVSGCDAQRKTGAITNREHGQTDTEIDDDNTNEVA